MKHLRIIGPTAKQTYQVSREVLELMEASEKKERRIERQLKEDRRYLELEVHLPFTSASLKNEMSREYQRNRAHLKPGHPVTLSECGREMKIIRDLSGNQLTREFYHSDYEHGMCRFFFLTRVIEGVMGTPEEVHQLVLFFKKGQD